MAAITYCRKLARKKGLTAQFHVGTQRANPNGHLEIIDQLPEQRPLCVVYDVDAYSYAAILDIFKQQPMEGVSLGTYNPYTKTIITVDEILK